MHIRLAYVVIAGCALTLDCARTKPAPPTSQAHPHRPHAAPRYAPVPGTGGALQEGTLFTQKLPTLRSALRIRNITVSPTAAELQVQSDTLLEVRSGEVLAVNNGKEQVRRLGDLWLAPKGSNITVKALKEFAVLRCIDLTSEPEGKQ